MEYYSLLIRTISFYSIIPPLLLGVVLYSKKRISREYSPIIILTVVSLLCDILARWAAKEYQNNMPVSHLYSLVQALTIMWFFALSMPKVRKSINFILITYGAYYIINSILFEPLLTFNETARIIQTWIIIPLSLYYFYNLYNSESTIFLERNGRFWIVVGILFYFSGAFFTFLFSKKILSIPDTTFFGTWIIHNISNFIKNLFFTIGLWLGQHER